MKIVYAIDNFGPNGPIPNSIGMRNHEFFSHFYQTPISQGMTYFSLPDFHKYLNYGAVFAHHTDILNNTELYASQGPIVYMINIQHNITYQNHFLVGSGRGSWLEYLPANIITLWKNKKCKIIISHIWDDCHLDIFGRILDSFYDAFGTCDNFYIWTTSIFKAIDIEKLDPKYRANVIHVPYAEMWSSHRLPKYVDPEPNIVKNKKFIKLIRRYTPGRVLSHISFAKENLNEHGFISIPEKCSGAGKTLQQYIKEDLKIEDCHDIKASVLDQVSLTDRDRDGYKNTWLGFSNREQLLDYFHRSYFSIVFESRFEKPTPYCFYTEKLIRAILYKHPFILLCMPQSLVYLRKAGYRTFNNIWSEDYDKIEDYSQRLEEVTKVVKDLCSQDLDNMIARCSEIVEHNRLNVFRRVDEFKTHVEGLAG
jgi:hypothetical protein